MTTALKLDATPKLVWLQFRRKTTCLWKAAIAVLGNTFRETGGDAGRLTVVIAGHSHEATGGTLERTDLTAAFGASRNQWRLPP